MDLRIICWFGLILLVFFLTMEMLAPPAGKCTRVLWNDHPHSVVNGSTSDWWSLSMTC